MLMDVSSEMIHALLPVYMTIGPGASPLAVGVIEGVTEATAAIVKVFSGALSDRLGRRKEMAAPGCGLAAITRPVFPPARSVGWLAAARFVDRVGKRIRGAPRDALVADLAPAGLRDAFGAQWTFLAGAGVAALASWGWRRSLSGSTASPGGAERSETRAALAQVERSLDA